MEQHKPSDFGFPDISWEEARKRMLAVPLEQRNPEMDCKLGFIFLNATDPQDRIGLKQIVEMLEPHEKTLRKDYNWNMVLASAYGELDQKGRALYHYQKALEAKPGDQHFQECIEDCKKALSLPRFGKPFRVRAAEAWKAFLEQEEELYRIWKEKKAEGFPELIDRLDPVLGLAFYEPIYEVAFATEEPTLYLKARDRALLAEVNWFAQHAPQERLRHWKITVGRPKAPEIGVRRLDGWKIMGDEILTWLETEKDGTVAVSCWAEKLLPEIKDGTADWMLDTMLGMALGSIAKMMYIRSSEVLERPKAGPHILLSQFPARMKELGLDLSIDAETCANTRTAYRNRPNRDPKCRLRTDTVRGESSCLPLVSAWLRKDKEASDDLMNDLEADGVTAGFLCYPLTWRQKDDGNHITDDFRGRLMAALSAGKGPEVLHLTGWATGLTYGYVDFLAWDLPKALRLADRFFRGEDLPWYAFRSFRLSAKAKKFPLS